ncbi:MAG: alpha/beta fold hydrolase [Crocinitomicaceae bacterium]
MKEIEILSNSEPISATLFEGTNEETVLIIASATGVKQEYYKQLAQFMADSGITTITFDYNGIGRSLRKPIKKLTNNAADWGRNDLESIIQHVISAYPRARKVVLGHSIGGQIIGLAKSSVELDKLILVASQSGYWKLWSGKGRIRMWFNWFILFPVVIRLFGYMNSKKLSGMENLPKNVANQWRNWGKNEAYILGDVSIKQTFYDKIKGDLTAFSIDDDPYAPKKAVQWMVDQYAHSKKRSVHLKPADLGTKKIGHFGVFKERFKETIWIQLLNEINDVAEMQ